MNNSASACCRLSARPTACFTSADDRDPKTFSMIACGSVAGHALGEIVGDIEPPPHAVDPGGFVVRKTLGRRRTPQRFAEQLLSAGEPRRVDLREPGRSHHANAPLARTLEFGTRLRPGLVRRDHRHRDLLEIAPVSTKHLCHPLDQRRRRFVRDEVRAPVWWRRGSRSPDARARSREHGTSLLHASHLRSSCPAPSARPARAAAGLKVNSPPCSGLSPGGTSVQPVNTLAKLITSFWV